MADAGTLGITVEDFTDNVLNDLGVTVVWIARTKFTDNITGSPTYVEAAPVNVQGVITKRTTRFNWNKEGLTEMGDAFLMLPFDILITKEDFIEYEGTRYRVDNIIPRIPGDVKQFTSVILFKVEDI